MSSSPMNAVLGVMKFRLVGATKGHALLKKKADALTLKFRYVDISISAENMPDFIISGTKHSIEQKQAAIAAAHLKVSNTACTYLSCSMSTSIEAAQLLFDSQKARKQEQSFLLVLVSCEEKIKMPLPDPSLFTAQPLQSNWPCVLKWHGMSGGIPSGNAMTTKNYG
eukprot:1161568-Pelagomonas_calceolata.AAC.1